MQRHALIDELKPTIRELNKCTSVKLGLGRKEEKKKKKKRKQRRTKRHSQQYSLKMNW